MDSDNDANETDRKSNVTEDLIMDTFEKVKVGQYFTNCCANNIFIQWICVQPFLLDILQGRAKQDVLTKYRNDVKYRAKLKCSIFGVMSTFLSRSEVHKFLARYTHTLTVCFSYKQICKAKHNCRYHH